MNIYFFLIKTELTSTSVYICIHSLGFLFFSKYQLCLSEEIQEVFIIKYYYEVFIIK